VSAAFKTAGKSKWLRPAYDLCCKMLQRLNVIPGCSKPCGIHRVHSRWTASCV